MKKLVFALLVSLSLGACGSQTADNSESGSVDTSSRAEPDSVAPNPPPPVSSGPIEGIDVSSHQGKVDYAQVKAAGTDFVYVRATDGITFTDSDFAENWKNAASAGLARGAYHFFESDDDAAPQAQHFLSTLGDDPGELPVMVDLEGGGMKGNPEAEAYQEDVLSFLTEAKKALGCTPLVYTNPTFANEWLTDSRFGEYPLWIAEYGVDAPKIPTAWQGKTWTLWQYEDDAAVEGVEGKVDKDRFQGNLPEFKALGCSVQ